MKKRTIVKTIIKWALIIAGTAALYLLCKEVALRERGYPAIGGEAVILFIPILYYVIEWTVRDLATALSSLSVNKPKEEIHMRTFYNRCTDCGARLDPGERCNCQTQEIVQTAEPTVTRQSEPASDQFRNLVAMLRATHDEYR